MELRKKIRAKDLAMTHWIPSALMISGACSLEEPQPKFLPATMMSPFRICPASSGRRGLKPYCFISSMVLSARYSVGMMISVSISSPRTQTRPVNDVFHSYVLLPQISLARAIFPAMAEAVTVAAEPK